MAREKSEVENLALRLSIADAIIAAVKDSGLLRAKRRATKAKRRASKPRTATPSKSVRKSGKRTPLLNVPAEVTAAN